MLAVRIYIRNFAISNMKDLLFLVNLFGFENITCSMMVFNCLNEVIKFAAVFY